MRVNVLMELGGPEHGLPLWSAGIFRAAGGFGNLKDAAKLRNILGQ